MPFFRLCSTSELLSLLTYSLLTPCWRAEREGWGGIKCLDYTHGEGKYVLSLETCNFALFPFPVPRQLGSPNTALPLLAIDPPRINIQNR